ncbi:GNAT family N-acetyltransferase [Patulibacter brassicae]|uniref:GNAT family N-acetyltransferase n=1 Tax=Patulibacter brassicae TaxID=1705717 RepID=A0ABU4VE74_9ACTN|nr:GNAT family N-acetyltransferase [Patulibacter brassicae]MDX8150070.1 GNAT family N-acetyltransferase [Patulibacter brassicae]
MAVVLEPAGPSDAAALAEIQVAAWLRAYQDVLDPLELAERTDVEARREAWATALRTPATGEATVVARLGPRAVGLCVVREAGTEPDLPGVPELRALYVHPVAQGAGVGGALHDDALRRLAGARAVEATLRVFSANWAARRFWAGRGWSQDQGAPPLETAGVATERWRRPLGPVSA